MSPHMRLKEQQSSRKTIPKLVRTREESKAALAPLQVVVYEISIVVCGLMGKEDGVLPPRLKTPLQLS